MIQSAVNLQKRFAAGLLVYVIGVSPAFAQQTWSMATVYPADTMAGHGIERFSTALVDQSEGDVIGQVTFGVKHSANELIASVLGGRLQACGVFGGSLVQFDPIFELATLPFNIHSIAESKKLADLAEPYYRAALSRMGLHLLFVSPWPPTGLWSRKPISTLADIQAMRIRTYSEPSARVLSEIGAHAQALPIQDVKPMLLAGTLDGVLSSGDGAVGRSIHSELPNFTAISYAYPFSFVVMGEARYRALSDARRGNVDRAAEQAKREQWAELPKRVELNYRAMHLSGVRVKTSIDADLSQRFNQTRQTYLRDWLSRVNADYADIVGKLIKDQ